MNYDELIASFKLLNDNEKKEAIIEFMRNTIKSMATINQNIGNIREIPNTNIENSNDLDTIYELLHVMAEETSSFAEHVENTFYE